MELYRDDLVSLFYGEHVDDYTLIECTLTGTTRWGNTYRMVFFYKGDIYLVDTEQGATEMQDYGPFDDHGDIVDVHPAKAVEKTVIVYEKAEV